jgi:hypothetical protein
VIEVVGYGDADRDRWDALCAQAVNASLLHTRRFLSYHGERIRDRSMLLLEDGRLAAVLPAGESPSDPTLVSSHPGATFGGVVHQGRLRGNRMIEALQACVLHLSGLGYRRLHYKPVPHIYQAVPAQDDLYALFRLGATRFRCDLACTIDLAHRGEVSERRRRGLKKALKVVELSAAPELLEQLWTVLAANLARKHDAAPVHTLAELAELRGRFPGAIVVRCALIAGKVEAGVVFFNTPGVWHAQYIAASEAANEVSALDAVFDAAIDEARRGGARWFDFGTSNEQAGQVLNDGLYRFKSEFGGGGVAYEHYELSLGQ